MLLTKAPHPAPAVLPLLCLFVILTEWRYRNDLANMFYYRITKYNTKNHPQIVQSIYDKNNRTVNKLQRSAMAVNSFHDQIINFS